MEQRCHQGVESRWSNAGREIMERMTGKSVSGRQSLGLGSSFAAGALMLCHMNSSGLGRYDKLIADLSRLGVPPAPQHGQRRTDRPLRRQRMRWVSWLYR